MPIDWDALVLSPVMGVFGEGVAADQTTWPIYTPRGLAAFRLADAVFDSEYQHTVIGSDGQPATTHKPMLGVRTSLFPRTPAQSDQVQIMAGPGAGNYIVKDVESDGHGHAKLILMGPTA